MSMEAICGSKSVVGSVCARARVCVCRGGGGGGGGELERHRSHILEHRKILA